MAWFQFDGMEVEAVPLYESAPVETIHGPAIPNWGDWKVWQGGAVVMVAADEFARIAEPLDDEAAALLAGEVYV